MDLFGWDYQGRNIDVQLLNQFKGLADFIADETKVNNRPWSRELQFDIATAIGLSGSKAKGSGQIRTVKRVFEELGMIKRGSLSKKKIPTHSNVISSLGKVLLSVITIQEKSSGEDKKEVLEKILKVYESVFAKAMLEFYFPLGARKKEYKKGKKPLHPLRASVKALKKYNHLDKWEWYLLNTIITEDDNVQQEKELDKAINEYRSGKTNYSMQNVKGNKKGHQYLPQYFGFAGLVKFKKKGRGWTVMELSGEHPEIIEGVLKDDFIQKFYADKGPIDPTEFEEEEVEEEENEDDLQYDLFEGEFLDEQ